MKEVSAPGTFCGHSLKEIDVRGRYDVQIVLVRRPQTARDGEWLEVVPGPETRLELGDQIVAVGPQQAIKRLESL